MRRVDDGVEVQIVSIFSKAKFCISGRERRGASSSPLTTTNKNISIYPVRLEVKKEGLRSERSMNFSSRRITEGS